MSSLKPEIRRRKVTLSLRWPCKSSCDLSSHQSQSLVPYFERLIGEALEAEEPQLPGIPAVVTTPARLRQGRARSDGHTGLATVVPPGDCTRGRLDARDRGRALQPQVCFHPGADGSSLMDEVLAGWGRRGPGCSADGPRRAAPGLEETHCCEKLGTCSATKRNPGRSPACAPCASHAGLCQPAAAVGDDGRGGTRARHAG